MTIVIANCRIEIDCEKLDNSARTKPTTIRSEGSPPKINSDVLEKLKSVQKRLCKALSRLRILDVKVVEVDVVIVKGFVAESLLHFTACDLQALSQNRHRYEIMNCMNFMLEIVLLISSKDWCIFISVQSQDRVQVSVNEVDRREQSNEEFHGAWNLSSLDADQH